MSKFWIEINKREVGFVYNSIQRTTLSPNSPPSSPGWCSATPWRTSPAGTAAEPRSLTRCSHKYLQLSATIFREGTGQCTEMKASRKMRVEKRPQSSPRLLLCIWRPACGLSHHRPIMECTRWGQVGTASSFLSCLTLLTIFSNHLSWICLSLSALLKPHHHPKLEHLNMTWTSFFCLYTNSIYSWRPQPHLFQDVLLDYRPHESFLF